jgi:hypothetical protein
LLTERSLSAIREIHPNGELIEKYLQARDLLNEWVGQGWLAISEPSRKLRRYRLIITAK